MRVKYVAKSQELKKVFSYAKRVAPVDATVLIQGETGTGKELLAQFIHRASPRRHFPFVALNCAALPEGLLETELFGHERGAFTGADRRRAGRFEQANGGTLFLDEIGDMSLTAQAKVLRVLQDRVFYRVGGEGQVKVNVRIIAATNKNLKARIKQGSFREDLYYRLCVVCLRIPPLRSRPEDIPCLAKYFLKLYAKKHKVEVKGFEDGALGKLHSYPWPGNVRELENLIERAVILASGPLLTSLDLTPGELSFP